MCSYIVAWIPLLILHLNLLMSSYNIEIEGGVSQKVDMHHTFFFKET